VKHLFFPVEKHVAYRRDPAELSDDEWAALQRDYGFVRRDSASWWKWKLEADFGGDVHRMMREYPVQPSHAFSFQEGRWIFVFHEAAPRFDGEWYRYADVPLVEDETGAKTYDPGEPVVFGVDTSHGVGADASALSIRGQRTRRAIATWKRNDVGTTAYAGVIKAAAKLWAPVAIVVEDNGIGGGVYDALASAGLPVHRHHSEHVEKWDRMMGVKADIAAGVLPAGPELKHEIEGSVQRLKVVDNRVVVVFDGPDDLLNAHGFAGVWIAENPFKSRAPRVDTMTHFDQQERLRRKKKGRASL